VSSQKVLLNRSVEAAVIENSSDTILAEGLGYDRCQVGIITNIDATKHFDKFYIETADQVCNVLRTQMDVVLGDGVGVLNAADPLAASLAEYCDGEVIFFTRQADAVAEHLRQGGRAVLVRDGSIVLASGAEQTALTELAQVPLLQADHAQMDSVLAAVAAAWALGISPELMRAGLATFENTLTKETA
jgi:cyanophycin synthetase